MSLDFIAAPDSHSVILALGPLGRGIIGTIVIGLITGVIAKFLTGDREPTGCIITMLIGIVGAFLAEFIGRSIGHYQPGEAPGFIASVIGAVLLLIIYHFITRRTGGPKI